MLLVPILISPYENDDFIDIGFVCAFARRRPRAAAGMPRIDMLKLFRGDNGGSLGGATSIIVFGITDDIVVKRVNKPTETPTTCTKKTPFITKRTDRNVTHLQR